MEDLGLGAKIVIERMPPLILQFDLDTLKQEPILIVVWILLIGMTVFFVSATILVFCMIRNVYQGKALFQSKVPVNDRLPINNENKFKVYLEQNCKNWI